MDNLNPETIDKIYEKGSAHREPVATPDGGFALVVPNGYKVEKIPPLEPTLPRIRQTTTFYDLPTFVSYVNLFKTEATRIFATPGHISNAAATLTAILDYHPAAGKADYKQHVATYTPPYSEEWVRWTKAETMLQVEFAEFIEENRKDIVEPSAAFLLDIVSKFRAKKTSEFDSVVHQPNGDCTLAYSEKTEHAGKTPVVVPQELTLGIPVFFKGTRYSVPVFLRYKLRDSMLTFTPKVDRADYVEQAAFDEITTAITKETGIEVYLGKANS